MPDSNLQERKRRMEERRLEREALRREIAGLPAEQPPEPSVSNGDDDGFSLFERMQRRSTDVDRTVEESVRGKK